jgi:hypothetical protein
MTFAVYARRWGHVDAYNVTKTTTGWYVEYMTLKGQCDKRGEPVLYANFRQDSINYPADLGDYLEYLWEAADANTINAAELQANLQALADWVSSCEKASPAGFFESFK